MVLVWCWYGFGSYGVDTVFGIAVVLFTYSFGMALVRFWYLRGSVLVLFRYGFGKVWYSVDILLVWLT